MTQVGNSEDRLGGQYMIQDRDHQVEINQPNSDATRATARQADQSQSESRQQGAVNYRDGNQGGERRSQSY